MTTRARLLSIVKNEDVDALNQFMKQSNKGKRIDWEELLNGYSKKELECLWRNLYKMVTTLLLDLESTEDNSSIKEMEKSFDKLHCICTLAIGTVEQDNTEVPSALLEVAVFLHDLLQSLPDFADKLKNQLCKLFEIFWLKQKQRREELISDLKRLWKMHKAMELLKLDEENSDALKNVLNQCFVCVHYLKHDEGIKILSQLLMLNVGYLETAHKVMKNHMLSIPKNLLCRYGEIYFCAWTHSTDSTRQKIENYCIQDLMYFALHVETKLAAVLRKVLSFIHKQKKQKAVDKMLYELYTPILWRSLKVANHVVRANAVCLLTDVFPLQNPNGDLEETDQVLQKHFDTFENLLMDPCSIVRSKTIIGICKILSSFWEMIPKEMIRNYIMKLIQELAWDASSSEVRESVLKGLTSLFDNHFCHLVLRPALPKLQNLFHDTSEKVRIAMVDLLLRVKGLQTIKYWNIVPVEQILTRLEVETQPVSRRIMRLIFQNFLSSDKPADVQLTRVILLIETNRSASRKFFQYAARHMTLTRINSFITLVCCCILKCVRNEYKKTEDEEEENSRIEDTENNAEPESSGNTNDDVDFGLSLNDTTVIAGLLDAIVILWSAVEIQLNKPANEEMELLQKRISSTLPELMRAFKNSSAIAALILIAGKLPPKWVPYLSHSYFSKLRNMKKENTAEDFSPLLETVCRWGQMGILLELIEDWLIEGMALKDNGSAGKLSKRGKQVTFKEPREPQLHLAIQFLLFLVENPVCQKMLIRKYKQKVWAIVCQLERVLKCIEKRFLSMCPLSNQADDQFLRDAFLLFSRLSVFLHVQDETEKDAVKLIEWLFVWTGREVLPVLTVTPDKAIVTRKRGTPENKDQVELGYSLIRDLFTVTNTFLLVNKTHIDFSTLTEFGVSYLQTDDGVKLLPVILKCFYQVFEQRRLFLLEQNSSVVFPALTEPHIMGAVLKALANHIQKKPEVAQILASTKSCMSDVLCSLCRLQFIDGSIVKSPFVSLVAAVLSELTNASEQDELDEIPENLAGLPPLSSWLLDTVLRKEYTTQYFIDELENYIKEGTFTNIHLIHAAVHTVVTVCKCNQSVCDKASNFIVTLKDAVENLQKSEREDEKSITQTLITIHEKLKQH